MYVCFICTPVPLSLLCVFFRAQKKIIVFFHFDICIVFLRVFHFSYDVNDIFAEHSNTHSQETVTRLEVEFSSSE